MKLIRAVCAALLLVGAGCAAVSYAGMLFKGSGSNFVPGPTLLSPVTEDIVLTGKDFLEFKWIRTDLVRTDHFDFRLYKGYAATASNRIFKQQFLAAQYPVKLPVSMFEAGQVYTWVLIQVYLGGEKGDKSFSSFKIIEK